MREIEVHMEGKVVVVGGLPDRSTVTYGGIRPDQPGQKTNTLRIYSDGTKKNQIAILRDVIWFRDMSLTITEEKKKKADWIEELDG